MRIPLRQSMIYTPVFAGWLLFLIVTSTLNADDSVTLKYTYRPDQTKTALLKDSQGKMYLPLADVARFYGVDLQFDAQTRRVFLSKNKTQVKLILSQPMFLISNPTESFPTDPVEEVDGQLAVTPSTAGDLLSAILGINSRFLSDQQALIVGGVRPDELKTEIDAQEQGKVIVSSPSGSNSTLPIATATVTTGLMVNARGEEEPIQAPDMAPRENSAKGYHVRCIVIDAGHGGKDIGAKGYDKKYFEKQATLSIATKVVQLLRQQPDLTVLMTRDKDYFVTLKGRTQFANKHHADLFVSIHCNSTPRNKATLASGTEIWVYSAKKSNHYADFEASRENAGGEKISFLDELHYEAYKNRSYYLADKVCGFISKNLGQHMRRAQQANFYVLARVDMPSILIETAFISNPKEEAKLRDPEWQDKIAKSIADGILAYRDTVEGSVGVEQAQR